MIYSKHALQRMQQRGLNESVCRIVTRFGQRKHVPGDAISYTLTSIKCRMLAKELRLLHYKVRSNPEVTELEDLLTKLKGVEVAF